MSCGVKLPNFKIPFYKNEGCYWTENLQNEMYLGCSITKESWKLRGSAILHFERYMTSRENKEFSVFTSPWSKLKIVAIQWIKSKICDTIDDWYINNLAKSQVSVVFHLRVICLSVSSKFIELYMETPCLCPSERHKYGGRKETETCATKFCYWNEKLLL